MSRISKAIYLLDTLCMVLGIVPLARREHPPIGIETAIFAIALVSLVAFRFCLYPMRRITRLKRVLWVCVRVQTIACICVLAYLSPLSHEQF